MKSWPPAGETVYKDTMRAVYHTTIALIVFLIFPGAVSANWDCSPASNESISPVPGKGRASTMAVPKCLIPFSIA